MKSNKRSNKARGMKRANNNSRRNNALVNQPRNFPLMAAPVIRDINVQVPIYAVQNGSGVDMYSLNFNSSQASPTLQVDLINLILGANEYVDLVKDFGFVQLYGLAFKLSPTVSTSQYLDVLTPIFATPTVGGLTTYTTDSAAASDSSVELLLNSTNNRGISRTYSFPSVAIGSSGYAFGGTGCWIATTSYASSANLKLLIGYKSGPTFNTSSKSLKVAVIDISFNMRFACPTFAN